MHYLLVNPKTEFIELELFRGIGKEHLRDVTMVAPHYRREEPTHTYVKNLTVVAGSLELLADLKENVNLYHFGDLTPEQIKEVNSALPDGVAVIFQQMEASILDSISTYMELVRYIPFDLTEYAYKEYVPVRTVVNNHHEELSLVEDALTKLANRLSLRIEVFDSDNIPIKTYTDVEDLAEAMEFIRNIRIGSTYTISFKNGGDMYVYDRYTKIHLRYSSTFN